MDKKLKRAIKWILDYVPLIIAIAGLCVAIPVSAVNAFSRYAFKYTFLGYDEYVRMAFAWIVFPGAAAAYWRHMHFGIDVVTNLFPKRFRELLEIIMQLFLTFLFAVLTYLSWKLTSEVGSKFFSITGISYAYYDASMIVGFSFMTIYAAIFSIQLIRNYFSPNKATDVTKGGVAG